MTLTKTEEDGKLLMSPKKNRKIFLIVAKYESNLHCMVHSVLNIRSYCDATHCFCC